MIMETFQTPQVDPSLPKEETHIIEESPEYNHNGHNGHNDKRLHIVKTLTKTVLARHSTRIFLDKPVPIDVLEECFKLAQSSPSSTNVQPWRLTVTSGPKLDRLRELMMEAVIGGEVSQVPPIPDQFRHYRSDLGHTLYGPEGYNIPRSDREGARKAQLRNYRFFDAPVVAVIGLPDTLAKADVFSVGLYIQTLTLLMTERGLGTCLQVSTAGYPGVIKKELGISEDTTILCTMAIGYEDESQHLNIFKMARDQWKDHVKFVLD